jgi:hypothetical protein
MPTSLTERPVFALVVGIDIYQRGSPPSLRGCVNDSNSIAKYLTDTLSVPSKNIKILQNECATRRHILDTFKEHFIENSEIVKGDAIVFYFAGHGSQQRAPSAWNTEDGKVETICPYDVKTAHGIPDITFAHLLDELSSRRGDNIVRVLGAN